MGRQAAALFLGGALAACTTVAPSATATTAPLTLGPSPVASLAPSPSPSATPHPTPTPDPPVSDRITVAALEGHLRALQAIADANGGHRASGSAGFVASLAYTAGELESFGYEVERQTWRLGDRNGTNLLVERPGTGDQVIMLGAHLDSVVAGPGINDDGSGVAAVLAIAEALAELPATTATIRLALWDAEEHGPFGSTAYVADLTDAERSRIAAYLNLDMIGSPNAVRFVYAEADAASGSEAITEAFATHFDDLGFPWEPIDLEGDSDHGPFIDAGIPTGGLFSGGMEPVTAEQASRFGAQAGVPADACSHGACDTIDNVDLDTLAELARAAASVLVELAGG